MIDAGQILTDSEVARTRQAKQQPPKKADTVESWIGNGHAATVRMAQRSGDKATPGKRNKRLENRKGAAGAAPEFMQCMTCATSRRKR